MLTSGTTGTPRGAARPQPRGPAALVSIIERIPLRVGSRTLLSAPIGHTWGYSALLVCLGLRHTIVLQRRFDAARARAALTAQHCDTMIGVPIMLQRLMQLPPPVDGRLPRLRVVATSGSAFPKGFSTQFMDAYGDVLYSLYGSTEASWICIATPRDLRRDPDTVGTPPLGTVVKVLDEAGREVPDGVQGRIFCGNQMVFDGYTSGEPRDRVDGLVFTGDVGHVSDGLFFVDGRADDMVVSGGENVYPTAVERVLGAHPSIRDVAVTGIPDAEFGQRLAAFVVLRHGGQLTAAEVQRYVGTKLARHYTPREVVFVHELPRTAMGKVPQALLEPLVRSR
jgi:acyl-coenzyme A synthetase/AMP-(fatty) acid ligase